MRKKVIVDNYFDKIKYNEGYWSKVDKVGIEINGNLQYINLELDIINNVYVKYICELFSKEVMDYYRNNEKLLNGEESKNLINKQKDLYEKNFVINKVNTMRKIEEAAIRKRDEILEDQTEESFSKIVGKEKAKRVFKAKTREEKLESIVLKKMRIFKDSIEISCTCDWFSPSGGFTIFEDGNVEMFYIDSMNI